MSRNDDEVGDLELVECHHLEGLEEESVPLDS